MTRRAMFLATPDGGFRPQPAAHSGWGAEHLRGMAISGLLAREAERRVAAGGMLAHVPARWTVDLCRPARDTLTFVRSTVLRRGRRVCVVDVDAIQGVRPVAHARALFVAPSAATPSPEDSSLELPLPPDQADTGKFERFYRNVSRGWHTDGSIPTGSAIEGVWHFPVMVVQGEESSPFVVAAAVADVANAVVNAGPAGLTFINADVTMNLTRAPIECEVGLAKSGIRFESAGVSVGSATMFDRRGPFGLVTVSGLYRDPIELGAQDPPTAPA